MIIIAISGKLSLKFFHEWCINYSLDDPIYVHGKQQLGHNNDSSLIVMAQELTQISVHVKSSGEKLPIYVLFEQE